MEGIIKIGVDNIDELRDISIKTFDDTFGKYNTKEVMYEHAKASYNKNQLLSELSNPASYFYFYYINGIIAGYLKINDFPAQSDSKLNDKKSLEVQRIYVRKEFQGNKIGKEMLLFAIDYAGVLGKEYIWLGVWENNEKAKKFYKSFGFYKVGEHAFMMGEKVDIDYIFRKDL